VDERSEGVHQVTQGEERLLRWYDEDHYNNNNTCLLCGIEPVELNTDSAMLAQSMPQRSRINGQRRRKRSLRSSTRATGCGVLILRRAASRGPTPGSPRALLLKVAPVLTVPSFQEIVDWRK
jgi:hypothetical protein